jgi:uncharacterized membrane protein YcjF (UPF0283 family)
MEKKRARTQKREKPQAIPIALNQSPIDDPKKGHTDSENTSSKQLELQIHLAEYDALLREHDLHHKMRQELGVYTLAATAALIGAFIGQTTALIKADFLRFFLVLPFFFTLMTWWYIRTNYSAALIEVYVFTRLRPRLSYLADAQVVNWLGFLYETELSQKGRVVLTLQTLSRLCLIQGPAFISLLFFGFHTNWSWADWSLIDWVLIISNLVCIIISVVLMIMTWDLILRMKEDIKAGIH